MLWNNLINAANNTETRTKIQKNNHLDQQCSKKKRLLQISLNFREDQTVIKIL